MRDLSNFNCQFMAVWDNNTWTMYSRNTWAKYYHEAEQFVEATIRREIKEDPSLPNLVCLIKHDSTKQ